MRFPTMFSPIQIGSVTVPNRFVVPPMANNFSDPDPERARLQPSVLLTTPARRGGLRADHHRVRCGL